MHTYYFFYIFFFTILHYSLFLTVYTSWFNTASEQTTYQRRLYKYNKVRTSGLTLYTYLLLQSFLLFFLLDLIPTASEQTEYQRRSYVTPHCLKKLNFGNKLLNANPCNLRKSPPNSLQTLINLCFCRDVEAIKGTQGESICYSISFRL